MSGWTNVLSFGWLFAPRVSEDNGGTRWVRHSPRESVPAAEPLRTEARRPPTIIDGVPGDTLVERIRAGDRDALSMVYVAFYDRLWRFAATLVGAADVAQEAVQDVFFSIWVRRATFEIREDLAVYLFAAVRHRAFKHDRHDRVVRRMEESVLVEPDHLPAASAPAPLPDAVVAELDVRSAVHAALEQLPARDRAALLLRWDEGRTYDEIGHMLGVTAMGAHKIVARALVRVRPLLERFRDPGRE